MTTHSPVALLEMEQVGEGVGRPGEDGADHPAEGKGDRERCCDPAQGGAAQQVGLDEEDVGRRPHTDADREPDGEREQEAAGAMLVWLTGPVPAATSRVANTANETSSPNAK